jgi:prepilin-type N-terminal cleavage/methylation domain-containing protein
VTVVQGISHRPTNKRLKVQISNAEDNSAPSDEWVVLGVFRGTTTLRRNAPIMENHIEIEESSSKRDKGFTLVELLIVIVILGILATVTVFAVRGITDKGTSSACNTDKSTLGTAVESYFAQYGSTVIAHTTATAATTAAPFSAFSVLTQAKPAGVTWTEGATPADTLVAAGVLRSVPTKFIVRDTGQLVYTSATSDSAACIPSGTLSGALVP